MVSKLFRHFHCATPALGAFNERKKIQESLWTCVAWNNAPFFLHAGARCQGAPSDSSQSKLPSILKNS